MTNILLQRLIPSETPLDMNSLKMKKKISNECQCENQVHQQHEKEQCDCMDLSCYFDQQLFIESKEATVSVVEIPWHENYSLQSIEGHQAQTTIKK